jgi:lipopolysaccharide export system permease protein
VKIIRATKADFVEQGKWMLKGVTELSSLDTVTFPMQSSKNDMVIQLDEEPEDFGEFEADLTTLNFFKLRQFIKRLSKTGLNIAEYEIILLNKLFLSLVCLVFALLPVSTIFNPNRRSDSFGKNVVQTLIVTVVFWVAYSSALAFGNSGTLNPWVAAGIVPSGFFSFVLYTFLKNRKLSA